MRRVAWIMTAAMVLTGIAGAADSPQFRGPNRDGRFPEQGLLQAWPEGGPPVAWITSGIGMGYASPSIVGDTIYVPGLLDDNQGCVVLLDLAGSIKSKLPFGSETLDNRAPGPRSSPTIDGNRLYLVSGTGVATCLGIPGGEILWQVNILDRFQGEQIQWSIAESPLVEGDKLICTPGGPDASVVALDKLTGETIWTSKGLSERSAYCTPNVFDMAGNRVVVTMTGKSVVGLNAETGTVLWTHRHETDHDIHAVTPVLEGTRLYYTAGYGSGGGMVELAPNGASVTPKWTDKNLDCQHHGVVLVDGYVFGTGHKNNGLMCLKLETGELMWKSTDIGQGAVVYADGMLYVYEGPSRGVVSLVKATPDGFARTGTFTVSQGNGNHWAHPTIAGKRLYIRHGDVLIAYDIAAP